MADVTDTELAYMAGFFDGEGCDPRVLRLFQSRWGGKIHTTKWYELSRQEKYVWQLYGANSRTFLESILPYLISKKSQVDIFLATLDIIPTRRGEKRGPGVADIVNRNADLLRQLKRKVG